MAIALSTLLADVRIHLANSQGSDPFWTDTDLTFYINSTLKTLWAYLDKESLRQYVDVQSDKLIATQAEYDLPSTSFYMVDRIYYNGNLCRKIEYEELTQLLTNSYSKPTKYQPVFYVKAGKYGLSPTPAVDATAGGQLYYIKMFTDLAEDVDTILLADKFIPVISKLSAGNAKLIKESAQEGGILIESGMRDLKGILTKRIVLQEDNSGPTK